MQAVISSVELLFFRFEKIFMFSFLLLEYNRICFSYALINNLEGALVDVEDNALFAQ